MRVPACARARSASRLSSRSNGRSTANQRAANEPATVGKSESEKTGENETPTECRSNLSPQRIPRRTFSFWIRSCWQRSRAVVLVRPRSGSFRVAFARYRAFRLLRPSNRRRRTAVEQRRIRIAKMPPPIAVDDIVVKSLHTASSVTLGCTTDKRSDVPIFGADRRFRRTVCSDLESLCACQSCLG